MVIVLCHVFVWVRFPHCLKYARIRIFFDSYFPVYPLILSLYQKIRASKNRHSRIIYPVRVLITVCCHKISKAKTFV